MRLAPRGVFLMSRFANRLTNSLFLTIVVVIHYFCRKLAIRSPNHNPLYHMLGKISLTSGEQFSSVAKFFFKDNRNRLNTERLCFGYKLRVRKLIVIPPLRRSMPKKRILAASFSAGLSLLPELPTPCPLSSPRNTISVS